MHNAGEGIRCPGAFNMSPTPSKRRFASRAGEKLAFALDDFKLDVTGNRCADFGCNVGGFTDCLLQRGAAMVHAVDTGYGTLAYPLRMDERVVVQERTNALHAPPPETPADLVVVDLGWTVQRHAVPAALRWLPAEAGCGRIISLVKPHYEIAADQRRSLLHDGCLDPADAIDVFEGVLEALPRLGVQVLQHCRSPLTGRKSGANIEFLVLMERRRSLSAASGAIAR